MDPVLPGDTADLLREQLCILDQSRDALFLILISILSSFYTTGIQREALVRQLCCPEKQLPPLPDILPIQKGATILVLGALSYYLNLSGSMLCESEPGTVQHCRNEQAHMANALVLAAAAVRFGLLIQGDTAVDVDTP